MVKVNSRSTVKDNSYNYFGGFGLKPNLNQSLRGLPKPTTYQPVITIRHVCLRDCLMTGLNTPAAGSTNRVCMPRLYEESRAITMFGQPVISSSASSASSARKAEQSHQPHLPRLPHLPHLPRLPGKSSNHNVWHALICLGPHLPQPPLCYGQSPY